MPHEEGRPHEESGPQIDDLGDGIDAAIVSDLPELWETIRTGWCRSGDAMPRPGSLAWRALPADDPVRMAAAAVEENGAAGDLRRHGPLCARLLAEVAE